MNLEQTFIQFLKDWLAWAEADAPEHEAFSIEYGLCRASERYDFSWRLRDSLKAVLRKDTKSSIDHSAGTIQKIVCPPTNGNHA